MGLFYEISFDLVRLVSMGISYVYILDSVVAQYMDVTTMVVSLTPLRSTGISQKQTTKNLFFVNFMSDNLVLETKWMHMPEKLNFKLKY